MKIKKLKMDNFAKFTDFEVEFDDKITHLVGINGSGKTTIGLTAIWACLKGISKNAGDGKLIGERYRFIGADKDTANIELTLIDETCNAEVKITNNISKDGNKIIFRASKNYKMDEAWLNNLFSVALLSAKNFIQHTSKEQAILLGIDTKSFDSDLKKIKEEYKYTNRELKSFGEINRVEKVEKVSIGELLAEKRKADEFNAEQDNIKNHIDDHKRLIPENESSIDELLGEIEAHKTNINLLKNKIKNIGEPKPQIDTYEIINKINNAEETNQKAMLYQQYLEKKAKHDAAHKELEQNKQQQQKVIQERLEYITSFEFDLEGLIIGEDGGLLLNNRPLQDPYFSRGELEIIVARLHAKINPGLKMRFIDDFELLDEKNQKSIIKTLSESGFQIITAQVGDNAGSGENTILLRECKKIVD